ncbi:Do family serine endopeptidase [Asticcacaulis solisilvae]|uniref:Do family serine endopeptidase n=1 Tax=Asticcacaulis solisilvae TaxID=1217274 RepID=UPI003FD8A2A9
MGKLDLSAITKNKSTVAGAVVGLALGAGVAAAAITGISHHSLSVGGYDGASLIRTGDLTPVKPPAGAPMSFADMIDRVSPAVVSIQTKGKMKIPTGLPNLPGFDFPGGGNGDDDSAQGGKEQEVRGAGSGFFVSPDGYVVTNNHVIEGATDIQIVLSNDKQLKATIVGRDVATDLAVLKVEGHDFPFVRFELEHKPRVGDWVVAMGNPFNFSNTATAGIVSAYGRDLKDSGADYVDYLQIDAAINRGNSGGPTFDLYGRVIGVNTAIVTPSGANAGVGFAIPADVANRITTQLMKGVKIERGYIGVSIMPVTDEAASALGVTDTTGAYVADLTKGGPADKAGIQLGDIVKTVNGQPVKSPTELTRRIADIKVGEKVTLGVLRGGKMVNLTLTAALRPGEDELAKGLNGNNGNDDSAGPSGSTSGTPPVIGLSVKPLTPESRRAYGIGNDINGVVITNVDASSDGGQQGLKPGDVIVLANQQSLTSQSDFARVIDDAKKAGRTSVLLLINRAGRNLPLVLPVK